MRPNLVLGAVLVALLAAACGGDESVRSAAPTTAAAQEYTASATVLEAPGRGPELCLGGVRESYPPQCGGPALVGWDWATAEGEESANGVTWGDYAVQGTWDGERLTLTQPPEPPTPPADEPIESSTPCEPPPGGWAVVDPATATEAGQQAAIDYARHQPDLAAVWVDQSINPASQSSDPEVIEGQMNDPSKLVLNLKFTGGTEAHEAAVREVWGGPLCVTSGGRPLSELRAIQDALHDEVEALSSSVDEIRSVVEVSVVLADPGQQEELDRRYGDGVVELRSELQPVG